MNNTYLHPLDYVIGAKYYLTDKRVSVEYRVSSKNFYVEEIVDWDRLGYSDSKGHYMVFKLVKWDTDTLSVLNDLERTTGIPMNNFIVLGLKDRDAWVQQYVFIKRELIDQDLFSKPLIRDRYRFEFYGYVARKPRTNSLLGNRFTVVIEDLGDRDYEVLSEIVKQLSIHGLPSYYGFQRFGVKRVNTHLLGKYLVLGRIDLFAHELLYGLYPNDNVYSIINRLKRVFPSSMVYERIFYRSRDPFKAVSRIREIVRDLYIDAYVSYLYNMLLNKVIESMGWSGLDRDYPTIGCIDYFDTYYRDILLNEEIPESRLYLFKCWFRYGLFKPMDIVLKKDRGGVRLSFELKKGFYASIVLREVFKENYIVS